MLNPSVTYVSFFVYKKPTTWRVGSTFLWKPRFKAQKFLKLMKISGFCFLTFPIFSKFRKIYKKFGPKPVTKEEISLFLAQKLRKIMGFWANPGQPLLNPLIRDFYLSLKNFLRVSWLFGKFEAHFLIKWFLIKIECSHRICLGH